MTKSTTKPKSTAKPEITPETRTTPRQRLVGRRRPPIDPVDVEFPEDAGDDAYVAASLAGLRTGRDVLPKIALADALGAAGLRRLQGNESLCIVVEVPSPDWIPHIESALRAVCSWAYIACKSGSSRMSDKPSEGNDKVSSLLSNGARVAGVSQSPARYLPVTLVSGADLYVRVGPISNRSVSRMIRAATGMRPRRLPRGLAAGLDFDTVTACVRLGGTPQEAVRRLQAATAALSGGDALLEGVPALEDLHGFGSAMTFSKALVRDLDAWREGRMEWQDISRSCLWASEPGLGKTTLARAVAKAARVPLVSMSLGELFATSDGYLGGVLRAAEQAFQRAAANSPSVLFIDECDSIPDRSTLDARAREWWTPLVNFFLTSIEAMMTGRSSRVIVIGATNNPQLLDPALVRPGRLHPLIQIQRPDAADLARIFRGHLAEDLPGEDLTGVAHIATGATGADVVAWVKQARATARAEARRMTLQDLVAAVAPGDDRPDEELRIVARHEAAHACASLHYDLGILRSVTIEMGRSSAGATRAAIHPRQFHTREQIEAIVVTSLAGRAMDQLGGAVNSGSGGGRESDLSKATAMIAQMHGSLCMGDSLVYRGEDVATVLALDPSLRQIVERDLQKLYGRACAYVREHAPAIDAVAERLLKDRVLTGEVVREIVQAHRRATRAVCKGGRDVR